MEELLSALMNNGPMGIVAALLLWQMMSERKDRKTAEKALNEHLTQDITDKVNEREALNQQLAVLDRLADIVKGIGKDA